MMTRLLRLLFCWLLLASAALAAPLETSFFSWEIPDRWTVERDLQGQWEITAPGPDPLIALVNVGYLTTTPELYLKGSTAIWATQGLLEPMEPLAARWPNQAWFLVKHHPNPGEKPKVSVKWVRWRGPTLVVTSFRVAQSDLESWRPQIQQMAENLKIKRPVFEESALRAEIDEVLQANEDRAETLTDLESARLDLNVARQDWEPFFAADKPPLYRAYIDYLEARYDAVFVVVAGPESGLGPDVVESRMQGLINRRDALRRELHGF